ncbi:MAG: hypothetical protein WC217_03060 [Candidatus Paceibacterota bacterium]|jgi:hypothetical protein
MTLETKISTAILILTFIAITWTAIETRRMANEAIESNLRPLILRAGQLVDWKILSIEDMKKAANSEPTLEFTNLKNTATEITGYVIIGHKKYPLLFNGNVRGSVIKDGDATKVVYNAKWSWLPQGGMLVATYDAEKYETTNEENQIYLSYKDIQGNAYFSREDSSYAQISEKTKKGEQG